MTTSIDPTSAATAAAATSQTPATNQTAAAANAGIANMGSDTFLKLLVAQLKYQNPMSPTDPSAFMAQTAQFTMVENLESLSKQSAQMLSAQQSSAATGMLGQQVVATGTDGKDITGIVTGMRLASDGPHLKVGNQEVMLSAVKEVDKPTTSPTQSSSQSSSTAPVA